MSEENVALVRAIYDAWREGRSARDLIAEDVEYVNPPYAVEPGTRYAGPASPASGTPTTTSRSVPIASWTPARKSSW